MNLPHIDSWVVLVIVILGGAVLLAIIVGLLERGAKPQYPYNKVPSLLTQSELSFYRVLQRSVDNDTYICPKVRLGDLITVRKGTPDYITHFRRVSQKHVDFVLCDSTRLEPLLAIELDDRSHGTATAREKDDFEDKALGAAQLPILRIPVAKYYQLDELRRQITQALYSATSLPVQ